MLDLTNEKGRYISAALALAAERPWEEVTLAEIATRAGASLVGLKAQFASKADILSAFVDLVENFLQMPRFSQFFLSNSFSEPQFFVCFCIVFLNLCQGSAV